jgi:transcription elongation GreA/GreB family factor
MGSDRKTHFIEELARHYRDIISGAHRAESEAGEAADQIQRDARRREDAKAAVESGRMAAGHRRRRERAVGELEKLLAFAASGLKQFAPSDAVDLGALVDVSIETDEGSEERTLFVLPVGAGNELHGPGGDGFVSVITPASPVGRALQGTRVGDCVEVIVRGQDREWTVVDLY